jgi:hypothetical protein
MSTSPPAEPKQFYEEWHLKVIMDGSMDHGNPLMPRKKKVLRIA